MGDCRITVEILEATRIPRARGFYDNFEKLLNFAIKTKGVFHSYIQSDRLSMDIDKKGFLLNIELSVPKDDWIAQIDIAPPANPEIGKLRFLDYRLNISGESYHTNGERELIYICFAKDKHVRTLEFAENLLADVNLVNELVGLWILDIEDDFGFKKEMAFRRGARSKAQK